MVKLGALVLGLLSLTAEVCAQKTVRIMPFGASIVSRCWRANLQTSLRAAGITNFEFVGSQTAPTCSGTNIDPDHEGHPGSQATTWAANADLVAKLKQNPPDVVIMLIGTNDVLIGQKPIVQILAAYDVLIGQMRASNSKMQIILSNLLPLDPARFKATPVQGIKDLNAEIAKYVATQNTAASPVRFVDNYSGFDAVKDTDDGEHPNLTTGVQKMAAKFFGPTRDAIRAVSAAKRVRTVSVRWRNRE
ncbi:carbohydrate esterase family 3 protein [Bipolaris oryzae ATCC 44560]|uniref:Carbohydrate esterase family 3 protein n=1 Tax=Bipolaris oryzae ATCC 44560 TaxID=930090 RepID=W6YSL4_COCMI|nr:carbohydrate esterase family 3 protein [Bipolaris oryzae ATCC 44560]EUC40503.1 carbohydrate esterase family 3 protein [Bipolaris oryzae ATCC 44560]